MRYPSCKKKIIKKIRKYERKDEAKRQKLLFLIRCRGTCFEESNASVSTFSAKLLKPYSSRFSRFLHCFSFSIFFLSNLLTGTSFCCFQLLFFSLIQKNTNYTHSNNRWVIFYSFRNSVGLETALLLDSDCELLLLSRVVLIY